LDAVSAAAHNISLQAFYGVMAKSPMALIVPPTSSIKSFADLSGKKVGISKAGSLTDFVTRAAVNAAGVKIDKVREVPLGDPASIMAALKRRDIDAFVLPVNFGYLMAAQKTGKTVQNVSDVLGPDSQFALLMAKKQYIGANKDNLKKLAKAYTKAIDWMKANKDATVKLAVAKLGMPAPIAEQTYTQLVGDFTPDGTISRAGMSSYAKALKELGIATSTPDEDAYLNTDIAKAA
jgi:ABC-type nitrate/sulfonate/bicarbonate transport system substrate-binding protein